MKRLFAAVFAVVLGLFMAIDSAEASRRLGSGKTSGAQREGVSQRQATPPAASQQAAAAGAAASRPGMSRWLAPLAGLAAGLGLAYLLGDQLGSMLTGILLVVAIIAGVVILMRLMGRKAPQPAAAAAGAGGQQTAHFEPVRQPAGGVGSTLQPGAGPVAAAIPAGFDADGFVGHAKSAFLELQAANDRRDLDAIREMTTDDMFQAIKADLDARGNTAQQVDVVRVDAQLLEVTTEGSIHWASVRFSGMLREDQAGLPTAFSEIWNLRKAADGSSGWLLAGIQQES